MKLWHKIALGVGAVLIFAASQSSGAQKVAPNIPYSPPSIGISNANTSPTTSIAPSENLDKKEVSENAAIGTNPTQTLSNQNGSTAGIKTQTGEQSPSVAPVIPDTYTNADGNEVQSPTYYSNAPAGATAKCRDGSYSFSQHRSGTCSHHGGVEEWL